MARKAIGQMFQNGGAESLETVTTDEKTVFIASYVVLVQSSTPILLYNLYKKVLWCLVGKLCFFLVCRYKVLCFLSVRSGQDGRVK